MKLLLTSGGLSNKSIINALADLLQKPFSNAKLAVIPTAMNVEIGDKSWFIKDLENLKGLGFESIDIVDISAIPRDVWEPKIREAGILLFGGGNTYHLVYWLKKSGLADLLPELLKTRVYVGISAGSIVVSHKISTSTSEKDYSKEIAHKDDNGLGFVNFNIRPHFNSPYFPKLTKEYIKELAGKIKEPLYAIDDKTAIKITDGDVEVITEGEYLKF